MIKEARSFKVYCDRCGASIIDSDTDDEKTYSTEQDAEAGAEVCRWTKIQISNVSSLRVIHLCPSCDLDTLKALDKFLTGKRRKL